LKLSQNKPWLTKVEKSLNRKMKGYVIAENLKRNSSEFYIGHMKKLQKLEFKTFFFFLDI